jgi:uncharacterized protein (DUF2236 family)
MMRAAAMLGMPFEEAPKTAADLDHYLKQVHPELQLTPPAEGVLRAMIGVRMPLTVRPVWLFTMLATFAIMPTEYLSFYSAPWWGRHAHHFRVLWKLGYVVLNWIYERNPAWKHARTELAKASVTTPLVMH